MNIRDVVKIISLQHARVNGNKNVTSPVFRVIVRLPRHLDISQRMNHGMRSDANQLFFSLTPLPRSFQANYS